MRRRSDACVTMASERVVIDASYLLEAVLPTSAQWQDEAFHLMSLVKVGDIEGRAPWLIYAEVAAVVSKRTRGRTISLETGLAFLADVDTLGIEIELSLEGSGALFAAAHRWQCGTFDALYVDLASRLNVPIATRDKGMMAAAKLAGVPIYST